LITSAKRLLQQIRPKAVIAIGVLLTLVWMVFSVWWTVHALAT